MFLTAQLLFCLLYYSPLQGKNMKPKKAKSIGLVDAIFEDEDRWPGENRFIGQVKTYAASPAVMGKPKPKPGKKISWMDWALAKTPVGRYVVAEQTLKTLNKNTKGKYPAPYKAFESVMNAARDGNFDEAMKFESECFADMCITAQCKSLMSLFFLQERCKKMESQGKHFKPEDAVKAGKVVPAHSEKGLHLMFWAVFVFYAFGELHPESL